MMNFKFLFLILLFYSSDCVFSQTDDLIAVVIITKHAEKGVEISYPDDPYLNDTKSWPNGLNHITEKGKSDCVKFGKVLKDKYGKYFKRKSDDMFAVLDNSPYSYETTHTIMETMFDTVNPESIGSSLKNRYALFGPKNCRFLDRRLKRALKSPKVKQLFNDNKELVMNITGVDRNDQTLIRNVPTVYESIQTESNNHLQQPDWLNETAINQLEDITTNLDKIYYSNQKILLLESGPVVEQIRAHLVDNTLRRPNRRLSDVKFGYLYVVGSNQFSALSNFLNICEKRLKFGSSLIIELDSQSNIKVYLYDSKTGKLEDKSFTCEEDQVEQCKMIPFLKSLDELIPVNYDRACRLPRVKTIEPNYNEIFKGQLNQDELNDNALELEKKRRNAKKFVEKEFSKMLEKNKKLLNWLSDLFERKGEISQENKSTGLDSEDVIKARFIEVLRERVGKMNSQNEDEQLDELLTKWAEKKKAEMKKVDGKNAIIENVENRIKSSIRDKELIREQQRTQLIKLVEQIRQFNKLNSLQRIEKAENFKKQIEQTIKDAKAKFNEKIDELKSDVQSLLEDKFDQIRINFNKNKLKLALNELETKFTDDIEERKKRRELELTKIKDRMIRLVDDNDLAESEKVAKLNEIKNLVSNSLDKEERIDSLVSTNPAFSTLSTLIQEIPNSNNFEFENVDEERNNELVRIEKMKQKLKIIERDILDYLEINKENKEDILDSLAKFNDLLQSEKRVSIGLLTRLSRLVNDEEVKEEIKEIMMEIINFVKTSNRNLLDVEADLTTLMSEIEASNLKVSNDKFNLSDYETNLNISKPTKLLRASNPSQEDASSAFNPKAFGLAFAVFLGTMVAIGLIMATYNRIKKRRDYEKV